MIQRPQRSPLLLCLLCMVFLSCQKQNEQAPVTPQPSVAAQTAAPSLPAKSKAELFDLVNATDDIDIIFMEKNYSVNITEGGAKTHISHISDQATQAVDCPEVCQMFVKGQGEDLAHVGVFLGENCGYYVFYQEGRRQYVNSMTTQGYGTFMQILSRVKASSTQ